MTMTSSTAVAPGNLGAPPPPAMLAPKVYALQQQGLAPTATYPTGKQQQQQQQQQESLSKGGKKSWSVRLGLSRHGQTHYDDTEKGWGTVSGGSALSRQMVYAAEPWLYGTVRSSRPIHEPPPRALLAAAPILLVCSCPEFLAGTVRKHGTCQQCGGRRLAGVPLGGTCRLPPSSSVRSRPSLTGLLRPAPDDPYDLMRRYRLVEPRSRARSTSPLRLVSQRENRTQGTARSVKDRSSPSADLPYVRPATCEWRNNDSPAALGNSPGEAVRAVRATNFSATKDDEWLEERASESHQRGSTSSSSRLYGVSKRSRDASNDWPQLQATSTTSTSSSSSPLSPSADVDEAKPAKNAAKTSDWAEETLSSADARRSILECDVNPYLLLKKQKDEDDSSDDLSDNALERDDARLVSSLFDPTKVKSIERIPNRSAFAAIGGQKIRVFNEPREISDDEDIPPISRIPIPKVSPKRPPRRLKEARQTLKSILKRGKVLQDSRRRKNVLFNVDNVIFAPEKPPNVITSSWARIGKLAKDGFGKDWRRVAESDEELEDAAEERTKKQEVAKVEDESGKVKEEHSSRHQDRRQFITIPNIKDPKVDKASSRESAGTSQTKRKISSLIDATRHEKPVSLSKTNYEAAAGDKRNSRENSRQPTESRPTLRQDSPSPPKAESPSESSSSSNSNSNNNNGKDSKEMTKMEAEGVAPAEPIIRFSSDVPLDERDLVLKIEENSKKSFLSRSQSDRTFLRSHVSPENANFMDTMRLGFSRKIKSSLTPLEFVENNTESRSENDSVLKEERRKVVGENVTIAAATNETIHEEAIDQSVESNVTNSEPFRRMRPTSWSPPPLRQKHRQDKRMSDSAAIPGCAEFSSKEEIQQNDKPAGAKIDAFARENHSPKKLDEAVHDDSEDSSNTVNNEENQRRSSTSIIPSENALPWGSKECRASARIEVKNEATNSKNNVCKITVSPRASPMVHRLRVGAGPPEGSRRTSILINSDQNALDGAQHSSGNNRVTISVGGEDSVCNPTVISVNTESPKPKIQSPAENRTLVILDNHRSNIVVESNDVSSARQSVSFRSADHQEDNEKQSKSSVNNAYVKRLEIEEKVDVQVTVGGYEISGQDFSSMEIDHYSGIRDVDENSDFGQRETGRSSVERKLRTEAKDLQDRPGVTKEALISKLLGDSLKKARDKGEIPDEGSDEAILRILKQSLLKGKEYESSESTIEANYSRSSSANSVADADLVSTNLFFDENPYEVIKEPIYEEIPDEPPPLPLSPPPTEDFMKGYLGEIGYYKKIGSYLSDDVFGKSNSATDDLVETTTTYLSKSPEEFFKKSSAPVDGKKTVTAKFELLNFLMDSKDRATAAREDDGDDEDDEEEEEDAERDLEALYEQKETSLGDLSSKSSQISNVSDSSEECNIILISPNETAKSRTVDIERTDSGVGSESSQASSTRGVARRWRTGSVTLGTGGLGGTPQVTSDGTKLCEDCEQRLDPLITDSGVVYAPFVCRKCSKKRAERKEIITEIVETEQKYGRDLQIILEEFHRPMLRAGLLTSEQLSAIFLNVEELLEHNLILAQKLKLAVERAQQSGDEDLVTVDVGKIFLESERMLHAFESYCTRQGGASLLLQNLEKEKELLRIFLKVSQMENTVLRRMNLNSFLMVPVQRVTKYPLLLARLLKATPSIRPDIQEAKERLEQAQANIELHLEHMNAEAKDVTSTKLWRRISIIQNGRRPTGEQDMVNIKLRKMAVEVLEWPHEEARFVVEGRLLVAQPTDNNWRRGRTVKLAPVTAMLVTNGKANVEHLEFTDDSLFPKHIGIKEATLLLVKEKLGRYSLLREPLYLDKCIVCCETDFEDYFEIQELSSKETFIFKAEDGASTKRWCRMLQAHAQSLGAWRKRRGALPNIMICGVARN